MAQSSRPLRVVIIDDTYDLRELLRLALTRGGLEVVGEAGDGQAGIECVREETPDVVLLDLSMPVMDGLEALPTIRQLVPHGKIVVLSGFGATQMAEKAMTIGADGYLQKGIPLKRIIEYVTDIVDAPDPGALVAPADAQDRPSGPALSVVRAGPGGPSDPGDQDEAEQSPEVSAWAAVAMAPYGVLVLADEPLFRLLHANPTAQRLLDNRTRVGTPLGSIAPELASLVAFNRLDGEASFEAIVEGSRVHASLRRAEGTLLVYLDSSSQDIGRLRRAIATTALEIRGPVAVLAGVAESIAEAGGDLTDTQRQRLIASVARQARILDNTTADLLTAAEIQQGSLDLDPRETDPRRVVEAVVESHLTTFEVRVDDPREVVVDPARLEHMVSNLVGNALKYGRAPYAVRLEPDPADPAALRIVVADSGDGVPEDFRDELFREFSRPLGAVATGTGLGLYVVRWLAEAQGGRVDYLPGDGGAAFAISLPAG